MAEKFATPSLAAALAGALGSLAALAALGGTPLGGAPAEAQAQGEKVQCFGIAKKGENDCGNAAGTHSCHGLAKVDYDGGEWKYVKGGKEACEKAGGKTTAFKGRNPSKAQKKS